MPSAKAIATTVNIHRAKTELSRLIERAERGEETIIARAGRPVARIAPLRSPRPRRLGLLDGAFRVPDNFNEPLPDEVLAAFDGRKR